MKLITFTDAITRQHNKAANHAASTIAGGLIVGPAIVVGVDGEDFCDIPEEYAHHIKLRWA